MQDPETRPESITPLSHRFIMTPNITNRTSSVDNETAGFPHHQREPIPFLVETPNNHEESGIYESTYPQAPANPTDANNDLDLLKGLRNKYQNNPAIGYLNINSLRGQKFSQLEQVIKLSELDIFCIDETKLTSEIPTTKFNLTGYQYPLSQEIEFFTIPTLLVEEN